MHPDGGCNNERIHQPSVFHSIKSRRQFDSPNFLIHRMFHLIAILHPYGIQFSVCVPRDNRYVVPKGNGWKWALASIECLNLRENKESQWCSSERIVHTGGHLTILCVPITIGMHLVLDGDNEPPVTETFNQSDKTYLTKTSVKQMSVCHWATRILFLTWPCLIHEDEKDHSYWVISGVKRHCF